MIMRMLSSRNFHLVLITKYLAVSSYISHNKVERSILMHLNVEPQR
jgi:hypothetical protein